MIDPVPLRPASTILLLRDADQGMEVLMVERHHQIDFASGALVFPGGKVDPLDGFENAGDYDGLCDGAEGLDAETLAFQISAIREAFEEAAILLARKDGELVDADLIDALADERKAVDNGELSMAQFARETGLTIALDLLVPFARWLTPEFMPKRFDTWFYLAPVPTKQMAAHDGHEMVDNVWITPQDAISAAEKKERTIIFPTLKNVEKLSQAGSVEEAVSRAQAKPIVTVAPWLEKDEHDNPVLRIQPDAGYGDPREPVGRAIGNDKMREGA